MQTGYLLVIIISLAARSHGQFTPRKAKIGKQEDRPAVIGLVHELIHAYHYMTGTYEQDLKKEERSTIGLREKKFRGARFTENRFRKAISQALRTSHRLDQPEKATVLD